MKATISELWETGREIISFDDSDTDRPQSFSDLKKCENVLLGEKLGKNLIEALIDNDTYMISSCKVHHPAGGGTMYILEVN